MKNKPIDLPDNELEIWAQLAPIGNWPGMQDGKPVTQVCDVQAFTRLIDVFKPEVLIDFEHRSVNSDDTTAAGWIQALRHSGPEGLEAMIRFTDVGADDIRKRRRRFLSPVWRLDKEGRPIKLLSAALTNDPNFTLKPVLNKSSADMTQTTTGASKPDTPPRKEEKMKELAAIYGLPETATEADILVAAKAAKDELSAIKKRLDEMDAKALEDEAESIAVENKDRICNKDGFKKLFVQNKAAAIEFLACVAKPEVKQDAVCNKADAKTPSFVSKTKDAGACQNKFEQWHAMPAGRDKDQFLDANAEAINDSAPAV